MSCAKPMCANILGTLWPNVHKLIPIRVLSWVVVRARGAPAYKTNSLFCLRLHITLLNTVPDQLSRLPAVNKVGELLMYDLLLKHD